MVRGPLRSSVLLGAICRVFACVMCLSVAFADAIIVPVERKQPAERPALPRLITSPAHAALSPARQYTVDQTVP